LLYTDEFREQIARLYKSGKAALEIQKEYGISKATIYNWSRKFENTGTFRDESNRSDAENEIIKLRKENKQLKMEVDILKQAALIMAQK